MVFKSTPGPQYLPRLTTVSDVTISSGNFYDIVNYNGEGKCDFISVVVEDTSTMKIELLVDGVQAYSIFPNELTNAKVFYPTLFIYYSVSDKLLVDQYPEPFDFVTNLTVKVVNTDSKDLKLRGAFIRYRVRS